MHPIWLARLDKARPVLVLTRAEVRAVRRRVAVAPITSTIRGLSSEGRLGRHNGLDHGGVANLDAIATIRSDALIRPLGALQDEQGGRSPGPSTTPSIWRTDRSPNSLSSCGSAGSRPRRTICVSGTHYRYPRGYIGSLTGVPIG